MLFVNIFGIRNDIDMNTFLTTSMMKNEYTRCRLGVEMEKSDKQKSIVVGVRLTASERDQLAAMAAKIGMSISQLVRKIVIGAMESEDTSNPGGGSIQSVRLTSSDRDPLLKIAEEMGISVSQLVRKIVTGGMDSEEIAKVGNYISLVSKEEIEHLRMRIEELEKLVKNL